MTECIKTDLTAFLAGAFFFMVIHSESSIELYRNYLQKAAVNIKMKRRYLVVLM